MIWYRQKQHSRHRTFLIILACAFLGALLLSACSSSPAGNATHSSSSSSSSAINQTLQSEGNAQLQTFQQWIALMQQYGGNVASYQQQYSSDQQALKNAN